MAAYYFDSSALVKRYVQETGSQWVIGLADPQTGSELFTTLVTGAEIVAAITRRERMGLIPTQDAAAAITAFKNHFRSEYNVALMTIEIIERAMNLAEVHGLRGYDAVQLASALAIHEELTASGVSQFFFVSADENLNIAVQAAGLALENPNDHP